MKIKKYYLFFIILLLFGTLALDARAEDRTAGSRITDINVEDVNGTTEIEIKSSAPFTYTIFRPSDPYKVVIDLHDTQLGRFQEKILVDRAGVMEITPIIDESMPDVAKFEIALTVPVDIEPVYSDNVLILAFDNPVFDEMQAEEEEIISEEDMLPAVDEKPVGTQKYVGEKISIDFQDTELIHVFRLIADMSGFNIVVSPEVKGRFSMKLTDVPWDQALDVILRNYGLSKTIEGNILRIAPTSILAKEEEEIARARESREKAGTLVTKVYPVNYANVKDIKSAIDTAKILTKRGFISVDARTSSVIIKDVEQRHEEYENLIKALDVATPQVSIDAKIVEVTTEFQKELGVQWGVSAQDENIRNWTLGAPNIPGGSGFNSGNPLMVNLPAVEVAPGKGGAIGLGLIGAGGTITLDLQLSAMESSGEGKVISNPKITTSDNEEAKIMQGKKIPYQTVSQDGTQTAFIDATLELTVTPHITPEGTIVMKILAKKNEADFAGPQVLGVPTIDIKEISTQVLIKNNDTLVIGGIFKNNKAETLDVVPGLADIPILGWFFQHKDIVDRTDELLIFITPRIVKQL